MSGKKLSYFIFSISFTFILLACTNNKFSENETIVLHIQHPNSSLFMQQIGMKYEIEHPNVKLKIINQNETNTQKPDIFFFSTIEKYQELVQDGLLTALDSYIKSDSNDLTSYLTSPMTTRAISILRAHIPNALYAIPLGLSSEVLLYNKDLFDQYDVPYPTNYMTWKEVLQLAQQFPPMTVEGEPLYGLSTYSEAWGPYTYINDIGLIERLHMIDEKNWRFLMATSQWREIWEYIVPIMKAGHIQLTPARRISEHPFDSGHAAMVISNMSNIVRLEQKDSGKKINWDIVTLPLNQQMENTSNFYLLTSAYGIANESPQKQQAWDLLKYIIKNTTPISEFAGRSLEAFYILEYDATPGPNRIFWAFLDDIREFASIELTSVINDEKAIDEALQNLQMTGQNMLDLMRLEIQSLGGEFVEGDS